MSCRGYTVISKRFSKEAGFTPLEIQNRPLMLRNRQRRFLSLTGFTLLELIFVAALIVIIVSLAAPRFSGTFNSLRAQDFISDVTSFARYAQARAVIDGTEKRIIFDIEKKTLGMDGYHKGQEEGYWRREKSRKIPDFISLDLKGKEKIGFHPSGTADEAFIAINVPSIDRNCLISIEAETGYVKVEEIKQ